MWWRGDRWANLMVAELETWMRSEACGIASELGTLLEGGREGWEGVAEFVFSVSEQTRV